MNPEEFPPNSERKEEQSIPAEKVAEGEGPKESVGPSDPNIAQEDPQRDEEAYQRELIGLRSISDSPEPVQEKSGLPEQLNDVVYAYLWVHKAMRKVDQLHTQVTHGEGKHESAFQIQALKELKQLLDEIGSSLTMPLAMAQRVGGSALGGVSLYAREYLLPATFEVYVPVSGAPAMYYPGSPEWQGIEHIEKAGDPRMFRRSSALPDQDFGVVHPRCPDERDVDQILKELKEVAPEHEDRIEQFETVYQELREVRDQVNTEILEAASTEFEGRLRNYCDALRKCPLSRGKGADVVQVDTADFDSKAGSFNSKVMFSISEQRLFKVAAEKKEEKKDWLAFLKEKKKEAEQEIPRDKWGLYPISARLAEAFLPADLARGVTDSVYRRSEEE